MRFADAPSFSDYTKRTWLAIAAIASVLLVIGLLFFYRQPGVPVVYTDAVCEDVDGDGICDDIDEDIEQLQVCSLGQVLIKEQCCFDSDADGACDVENTENAVSGGCEENELRTEDGCCVDANGDGVCDS